MADEQLENNSTPTTNVAQTAPNPLVIPISIVIAGVFVALAIIFSNGGNGSGAVANTGNGNGGTETPEGPTNEERLELAAMQKDDHVLGSRDAEVYILEFSDTECPFCKRFHETMNQIIEEYNGEVAWVYRNFPLDSLHRKARKEAEALECAGELGGNDGFWRYTNRLYEITPSNDGLDLNQLPIIATEVGLDSAAFTACLDSGKYAEEVQKDFENAVALGGRGTPHSLIISGDQIIPINGAQPFSVVKAAVDSLLAN